MNLGEEKVSAANLLEIIQSRNDLWEKQADYYRARLYPQSENGQPVILRTARSLVEVMPLCSLPIPRQFLTPPDDPFQLLDYYLPHHLLIPSNGLAITDGQRYLLALDALLREMGLTPRTLSIDADYFATIPEKQIPVEVKKLVAAANSVPAEISLVVADSLVDRTRLPGEPPVRITGTYHQAVEAINSGQVADNTYLDSMLSLVGQAVVIKPPTIERSLGIKSEGQIQVYNVEHLAGKEITLTAKLQGFDLIHFCTNPANCITLEKALLALREFYSVAFLEK